MGLVNKRSLSATLDNIQDELISGRKITKAGRLEAAMWLASRQGGERCYAAMFAPTKLDYEKGIRMYTGERITTGAGIGHMLGEETMRTLMLLDVSNRDIKLAMENAAEGIEKRLRHPDNKPGVYCCGGCTVSLWRNLLADGLTDREKRLRSGLNHLKSRRDGKHRWRGFPFHYTLLALSEMEFKEAVAEMKYAAPSCERVARRDPGDDAYAKRRRLVAERVLARC